MISARMNPRWMSEWITPAASGAVAPRRTSQPRDLVAGRGILSGTLDAVLERAEVGEDEVVLVSRQRRGRILAAEGRDHEQQCVHLAQFAHGCRRAAGPGVDIDHLDLDGHPL